MCKTLDQYEQFVASVTLGDAGHSDKSRLAMASLGLSGEMGEVVELVTTVSRFADNTKKVIFQDKPLGEPLRQEMILELGDVLWYVASGARALGVTLQEVIDANVAKLEERYSKGVSDE